MKYILGIRSLVGFVCLGVFLLFSCPQAYSKSQSGTEISEEIISLAESGDAEAQYALGRRYEKGDGIEKNLLEVGRWYALAAESGHEEAQAFLINHKKKCSQNVNPDGNITYHMPSCFIASATNDAAALHALAIAYWDGDYGVAQDNQKAVEWMQKAALLDLAGAQVHLGTIYDEGELIPQDLIESCAWFLIADKQPNLNELQRKVVDISLKFCRKDRSFFEKREARQKAKAYTEIISSTHKARQKAAAHLEAIRSTPKQ